MNIKNITRSFLALAFLTTIGCKSNGDSVTVAPQAGTADFTRFISLGNSLTAGYADNGLFLAGQLSSFPSIMDQQMKLAGGGEFHQPLFTVAQKNGSGYLKYGGLKPDGAPILIPVTTEMADRGVYTIPM